MPTEQDPLKTIDSLAPVVAAHHGALTAAIHEERAAEVAVLSRAIEAARPALRAICSRIRSNVHIVSGDSLRGESRIEYHEQRGLCLTDSAFEPVRGGGRDDTRGELRGCDLALLSDGTLAEVEYEGRWSRWQSEPDDWTSTLTPVTLEQAMQDYSLDKVLGRLATALQAQAQGKAPERAAAARERAARLQALATLSK